MKFAKISVCHQATLKQLPRCSGGCTAISRGQTGRQLLSPYQQVIWNEALLCGRLFGLQCNTDVRDVGMSV